MKCEVLNGVMECGLVVACCSHGKEISELTKGQYYPGQLRYSQPLKKHSDTCNYVACKILGTVENIFFSSINY
jgi:hypothetical protein